MKIQKNTSKHPPVHRIVILGAGESGAGATVLAKKKGFEVFVSENLSWQTFARKENFTSKNQKCSYLC